MCVPFIRGIITGVFNNNMITAGFSGSAPIAIGGGSVGDLFSARDRASAMAIYSLGPLLGTLPWMG
jgi:hypothetical protein